MQWRVSKQVAKYSLHGVNKANINLSNLSPRIGFLTKTFLGIFKQWRKATISFVMSVYPPVCTSALNNTASVEKTLAMFDN
jgi:hypothetical protein